MAAPRESAFHLFLSYTRTPDAALARELERLLEAFHRTQPPGRTESLPPLSVCVDGSDFSLPPIEERARADQVRGVLDVVYDHLGRSRELLVLCSTGAARSHWVEDEVRWFIEKFGPGRVRIAFTEGDRPWDEPVKYFPKPLLEHELHKGVAYDLRGYDARRAREWHQVPEFGREMVRLAADLHGLSSGELYPTWLEAELERARRQSATMASSARFETFAGDPSRAVLQAFAAHELHPDETTERALRDAYRVAVLHHKNRRELSQITGSGPRYLAARWKQGEVFTKTSPDGRYRLLVTKRGSDGPNPPGDVYLVNNETLRAVKLDPPTGSGGRVEDVAFDRASKHVFVARYFHVIVYGVDGHHIGGYEFGRHTKSPIHLLDGFFANRFILGAETKGGVWLADPNDRNATLTVHYESHGDDAIMFTDIAPGGRRATLVYESGKANLLELDADGNPVLHEIAAADARYAGFPTGRDDTIATTGALAVFRLLEVGADGLREILSSKPLGAQADWIAFDAQANRYALIGGDRRIHILDGASAVPLAVLDFANDVNWRETLAVPITQQRWSRGALWEPGEGVAFPSDDLAVSALQNEKGETWIATESWPNEYWPEYTVHRVESGRAHELGKGNLPVRWYGNILDLGSGRPYLRTAYGLARFPSDDGIAEQFLQKDDIVWIGSWRGLYELRGSEAKLVTPPDLRVSTIAEIDGKLWFGGLDGAFVREGDRLFRITDPFTNVSSIQSAGGHVWINGAIQENASQFLSSAGDGRPMALPSGQLVNNVPEGSGAAWLAESNRLHRMEGKDVRTIAIEPRVTNIAQTGRTLWLTTYTKDFLFAHPGPIYRMDVEALDPVADGDGGTNFVHAGERTLLIEESRGIAILSPDPPYRRVSLLQEDGRRPLELGASLEQVVHLGDTLWLLTAKSAFVLEGDAPVRADAPELAYTNGVAIGNESWLLATTGAVRLRDGESTFYDTAGNPPRNVVEIDGHRWILTGDPKTPGPAFRVRGTRLARHAPRGAGVADIVLYANAPWFLTRQDGRAGPMRPVGKKSKVES